MRLGILASHPIQYQAPWFRALAKAVELEVFFAHRQSAQEQGRAGFGVAFDWDVDVLSGYAHRFLTNVSASPDAGRFAGCDTPEIADIIQGPTGNGSHTSGRFDAFIVTGWYLKSYLQAVRACRAAGVPVLVRGDSQLGTPRSLIKRLAMELRQRRLLRRFDGFLSVGRRHREYLKHYGVPDAKIFDVPHFVDNEWFAARAAEARGLRSELRSRWGIAADAFCILFCGKLMASKRPLDLVRAAQLLAGDGRLADVHLLFVGSGESGLQLRNSCHVAFDAENPDFRPPAFSSHLLPASFVGFRNQTELPACYALADVLVLPSYETWGLVVNEAMACGLPAIVADAAGCTPDLVEEGRTGFVFPTGDVGALAERIAASARAQSSGHDPAPDLKAKMKAYDVATAVDGTVRAVRELASANQARQ